MKILFLAWNSYCNEDMIQAFEEKGHVVVPMRYDDCDMKEKQQVELEEAIRAEKPDIMFSFNYFPIVSEVCNGEGIRYVAWVYDSPYLNLYSYTVPNPCNAIFVFDYAVFEELRNGGVNTVFYLPMAVNSKRLRLLTCTEDVKRKYSCDVSFVGSLYTEQKHDLYSKFEEIDPFVKGYLDGIIQAQLQVYGTNFLQEMLTKDVVEALEKVYPTNPDALTAASPEFIYADYVLSRRVTAMEREKVVEMLSDKYKFYLYTNDSGVEIGKAINLGRVDYYNEMPYVFQNSKINLNISLRSIKTGIPLRAMDIMGSGGFLLTNYQQEFMEYFVPNQDFVYYESMDDLQEKVDFYLKNDALREDIARNGREKVMNDHSFVNRVGAIFEAL